ncbi:MAG: hypothetical protein ABIJ40_10210 [Bacteroidota bacterium]
MEEKLNKIFDELQKEAYNAEYHTYDYKLTNQIIRKHFEKLVGQIEPLVMQWRTRDEKPLAFKRIIIFSPCYPEESDMRKRIITGQFLELCAEATHWGYISEPSA